MKGIGGHGQKCHTSNSLHSIYPPSVLSLEIMLMSIGMNIVVWSDPGHEKILLIEERLSLDLE
jgi:hypothetical protein